MATTVITLRPRWFLRPYSRFAVPIGASYISPCPTSRGPKFRGISSACRAVYGRPSLVLSCVGFGTIAGRRADHCNTSVRRAKFLDDTALQAVRSLSIHADYRCRHSGACCTADWDVPVEVPVYRSLDEALSSGRVAPSGRPHDDTPPLVVEGNLPDDAAAMVSRTSSGDCVFYHRHSGLCVIHRDLGETALPSTC